ncbi:hypothetical protein MSG28_002549 [Choristoneura fumiferana]|uniref:Uncharacterized protein n=1 Tax=Choristoneura fumiferana TaxID=7141 RepID=A0ACC0JWE6_CHOFU|nr:hypothetical protein MSG28_002549 [Choristoneura fumiferana]
MVRSDEVDKGANIVAVAVDSKAIVKPDGNVYRRERSCAIVVRPATALVIVLMSTVMELSHSVKANEALSLPKRL